MGCWFWQWILQIRLNGGAHAVMLLVIFVATKSGTGLAKDGFCFVKNPARTVSLQRRRIQHPKVLFEKLHWLKTWHTFKCSKTNFHQEGFKSFSKHEMYQALNYWLKFEARDVSQVTTQWPWPFTLKSIWRQQKKNYGNSNISPCKKYNLQKNPLKQTKILQDIITL